MKCIFAVLALALITSVMAFAQTPRSASMSNNQTCPCCSHCGANCNCTNCCGDHCCD